MISLIVSFNSCNKDVKYIDVDEKSGLILELSMKNFYYLGNDIIIKGKVTNKSKKDIYITDISSYCGIEKKWDKKFYDVEPIGSVHSNDHGLEKVEPPPILLKSNEFKVFYCDYYNYTPDYERYDCPSNTIFYFKTGLYRVHPIYSLKTNNGLNKVLLGKIIYFEIENEWSFYIIFIFLNGLSLLLYIFMKMLRF